MLGLAFGLGFCLVWFLFVFVCVLFRLLLFVIDVWVVFELADILLLVCYVVCCFGLGCWSGLVRFVMICYGLLLVLVVW